MSVHLVRHAKAGSRSDWDGDDELRPLSNKGWRQAGAIADLLAGGDPGSSGGAAPSVLLTSPYLRCHQTLEPLAERLGLTISVEPRLAEEQPFEPVLELLATVPDGAVLCSHGDVVPATIAALERRGCRILTPADWRKGTVWTIERARHGGWRSASVWSPPR